MKFKDRTRIKGTFIIPDFRKFEQGFLQEKIDYAFIDIEELKTIRMPERSGSAYISINPRVDRLGYFEMEKFRLDGFLSQFVIAADNIKTQLGNVRMDNGVMFTEDTDRGFYTFEKSGAGNYDVKIENLHVGRLINDPDIGIIDGIFSLSGEARSISEIAFTSIEGDVNRLDYLKYPYRKIKIIEGTLDKSIAGFHI